MSIVLLLSVCTICTVNVLAVSVYYYSSQNVIETPVPHHWVVKFAGETKGLRVNDDFLYWVCQSNGAESEPPPYDTPHYPVLSRPV